MNFDKYAMPGLKAEYTVCLGTLIAMGYNTSEKLHLDATWYPIYDESHRDELNEKIVAHYALREIGVETVEQFVFYLGRTMREIMPYFNERYSAMEKLRGTDMLSTIDMTMNSDSESRTDSSDKSVSTQHGTSDGTQEDNSQSTTTSKSFDANLPATGVVGDFARYASHATESTADSSGHTTSVNHSETNASAENSTQFGTSHSTGNGSNRTTGRSGNVADLTTAYTRAIMNVDMEIINALEPCFMQLWGTYDSVLEKGVYCD